MRRIDADDLKEAINKAWMTPQDKIQTWKLIDNAPTVELTEEQAIDKLHETGWLIRHDKEMTERPHGKWIPEGKTYICSNCETSARRCTGYTDGSYYLLSDYCPDCGARMDEEDQEENT